MDTETAAKKGCVAVIYFYPETGERESRYDLTRQEKRDSVFSLIAIAAAALILWWAAS